MHISPWKSFCAKQDQSAWGGWGVGGEFAVTKDRWIKTAMHKPAEQTRQHKDDVVVNKVCLH